MSGWNTTGDGHGAPAALCLTGPLPAGPFPLASPLAGPWVCRGKVAAAAAAVRKSLARKWRRDTSSSSSHTRSNAAKVAAAPLKAASAANDDDDDDETEETKEEEKEEEEEEEEWCREGPCVPRQRDHPSPGPRRLWPGEPCGRSAWSWLRWLPGVKNELAEVLVVTPVAAEAKLGVSWWKKTAPTAGPARAVGSGRRRSSFTWRGSFGTNQGGGGGGDDEDVEEEEEDVSRRDPLWRGPLCGRATSTAMSGMPSARASKKVPFSHAPTPPIRPPLPPPRPLPLAALPVAA